MLRGEEPCFLAALLIIGLAGVAQGYNGDPLIIGGNNRSGVAEGTSDAFTTWNVSGASQYGLVMHSDGGPTPLRLIAADGNDNPALSIYAQNIAVDASGRILLRSTSGIAVVPVGANRVTIGVGTIGANTLVLATVQQLAGGAMVKAAVPNRTHGTFTIYLNKNATVRTSVAWTVIN